MAARAESPAAPVMVDARASRPPDVAAVARELAGLQAQTAAARARLARLQQALVDAEHRLDRSQAAELVEANEQLLSAALRARTESETAARALQEASRAAEIDVLTGLPNRLLLLDRFAHAIANARRHDRRLALLFLDLDNFKPINDTLGHAVGDQVLTLAAQCLAACVRDVDTVSRHGGDEFLILLDEVGDASDAEQVADKMIAALDGPHRVGDQTLRLTASIGICLYPDDGDDAETLIERADAAMYQAKRHGHGSVVVHGQAPTGEPRLQSPARASAPAAGHGSALADHERRHKQSQEANEQLLLAALDARDLQHAAEQTQRRQAEFLGTLAHELRNPLAPISTAAALLGRARSDETMLPRLQAVIERQVAHMSRLVGDLLDVSRASTGKLRLQRQRVDLAAVIDQAVEASRPAMAARQQTFDLQPASRPLVMHGDPVRLAQVLSNLLDNASKYTPDGGRIALAVAVTGEAVTLTVADSGIGIGAEALPHVFEPFMQDAQATGFNGIGLGIGLTVVRELVDAHGGRVVASSAGNGQGSQFVVTLPLSARDDQAS